MNDVARPPVYVALRGNIDLDRDSVLAIWRGNLGTPQCMLLKYDWFYRDCPHGKPLLQLLRHQPDDQWVGTACAGRRRMLLHGCEIRAGVLVDLAVSPDHRSLGPALLLQQGLIDAAAAELDLLYGFPNLKAAAVFKRMGYEKLGDMVRYARVLRHANYLKQKFPTWLARVLGGLADTLVSARDFFLGLLGPTLDIGWIESVDARMDTLWQRSDPGTGLVAIRDSRHAKWRFDECPLATIRYVIVTGRNQHELQAWFATQAIGDTLHVRDFWSEDGHRGLHRGHVLALMAAARHAGYVVVSMEACAPASMLAAWKSLGFVVRGSRPLFGRWSVAQEFSNGIGIFVTAADEDE